MPELKVGDSFPDGVTFSYIPYTDEKSDVTSCGIPITYDASKGIHSLPFPFLSSVLLFFFPVSFPLPLSIKEAFFNSPNLIMWELTIIDK
jgi:hypothetical protein